MLNGDVLEVEEEQGSETQLEFDQLSRAESLVTDSKLIQDMAKTILLDVVEHVLDCVTEDEVILAKKFPQRVTSEQSKNLLTFE